jgi:GNAT superfamily N-acetyltransferase
MPHPKTWEWEAQAHLRRASTSLAPGELLLVGRQHEEIVAAAHLHFDEAPTLLATFIVVLAVSRAVRGIGGAVAGEALDVVKQEAMARARSRGVAHALLTGNIHHENAPSRRLVERAGFEPHGAPVGEYQGWSLLLPVGG